jgi:formylglycine-generating enzyme required for sulfatase activity
MGSPSGERGRSTNEGPQTNVTITQPFYMGKYEVTQAQWLALMESNPSFFKAPNLPVETLSWDEANEFITALNDHITSTGQGPAMVRLPTEAEWEYAARAGTTTRFHFGDSLSVDDACTDDDIRSQYMWFCGSAENLTHPVGQLLPNAFGLHDMNGNAWEWCQDWIDLYPGGSVNDPQGPATGTARVYRGGSLGSSAGLCRSAYRNGGQPANRFFFIGLRLVAVP